MGYHVPSKIRHKGGDSSFSILHEGIWCALTDLRQNCGCRCSGTKFGAKASATTMLTRLYPVFRTKLISSCKPLTSLSRQSIICFNYQRVQLLMAIVCDIRTKMLSLSNMSTRRLWGGLSIIIWYNKMVSCRELYRPYRSWQLPSFEGMRGCMGEHMSKLARAGILLILRHLSWTGLCMTLFISNIAARLSFVQYVLSIYYAAWRYFPDALSLNQITIKACIYIYIYIYHCVNIFHFHRRDTY